MSNPFETETAEFLVLENVEGQFSLWPAFLEVPAGWDIALPAAARPQCLAWIEANWRDIRPKSVAAEIATVPKR